MAKQILSLFAFVVIDEEGEEGVLRRSTPIGTQPMLADSRARLEQFREEAEEGARKIGCRLDVAEFRRV